jgi:hypothetical protein
MVNNMVTGTTWKEGWRMEAHVNLLLSNIEKTRSEMIVLAHQYGYSNPSVIQCSQKLDLLLNVYHHKVIRH